MWNYTDLEAILGCAGCFVVTCGILVLMMLLFIIVVVA